MFYPSSDILFVYCPIRNSCDAYYYFTKRISYLTDQINDLRMEMEATTK